MARCTRCAGRTKLYKVGSGYSLTNMGGEAVTCPLCLGTGNNPDLAKMLEKEQPLEKEVINEQESRSAIKRKRTVKKAESKKGT